MHQGRVKEPECGQGKSCISNGTWNKTYAIEVGFRMLTDEAMNLIETKTGVLKEQQRITHRGKQLTARRAHKQYNIQQKRYHRPVTPAHWRNRDDDDRPNRAALGTGGRRRKQANTKSIGGRCRHADSIVEKNQRHGKIDEAITREHRGTLFTMNKDNNTRFTTVGAQIEEKTRQAEANTNTLEGMQTRIDALESNSRSSSSGGHKRNDQNSVRAVATKTDHTGFTTI